MQTNVPKKVIGNKTRLPWITKDLKKLTIKKNKLYRKK